MRISSHAQLATFIVKESFGDGLAEVVGFLLRKFKSPLRSIRIGVELPVKQVKLCLAIGIQHNFILFSQHKRGFNEYFVDLTAILHRLRYPSYVYCVKVLYGNVAEVLVEEILHHGQILHEQLISKTITKIERNVKEKVSKAAISDKLLMLVNTRFVEVCSDIEAGEDNSSDEPPPSKRLKTSPDVKGNICYRVCTARINYYHRDLQIVDMVTRKLGPKHGEIVSTMLRLAEVKNDPSAAESAFISSNEIFSSLSKELGITSRALLDVYLLTLTDDKMDIVMKAGDSGGGTFMINYRQAMISQCKANMEALVLERFGSKSLRLFRLLLTMKHLEQKDLEELAMIPAKAVKELLYTMFSQKYVSVSEVAKTADHAPSRTYYCFKVPVEQLSRQLLELNYKSILNLMTKRTQILTDNRRLLDKQQKVDAIIATLGNVGEDQRQEIEEMITPAEKQQLATIKLQTDRIENAELQLTATSLVWEMYLEYCSEKRIAEAPRPKGAPK